MAWYDFLNQNNTRGRDAGSIARQRLNARASLVPKGAGGLLGLAVAAPDVISSWNNIRNPKDNIFTDLRNLGTSIQNQFVSPGQRRAYIGSDPAAVAANRNLYSGVIGSIPASANGIAYNRAELELAEAARTGGGGGGGGNAGYSTSTFIAPGASQGGGFGGGGRYQGAGSFTPLDPYAAQNREYERERARVEAMVKANPDMQKQAIADERAKVRDQGMALWAKANPTLAKQVQPGAVGYDVIQRGLNVGAMGTPMDLPFDTSNVLGGTPMPEGLSYGTTTPTAIPGGTPIKGGGFPEGQAAMFQRFMQGPATTVPAFQGSPLGTTPQLNALNYGGAVQPLGTAISDDFYKTEKAKELAAMFANYRLGQ
jgi:hypothetical protein